MITHNDYMDDLLAQPAALKELLAHFSPESFVPLAARLHAGEFANLVISGMGSSYCAAYPAYLQLSAQKMPPAYLPPAILPPVAMIPAAELLHYAAGQIKPNTLLWLNSQSGRSAEIVRLLDDVQPGCILACVNDLTSPLALKANFRQPIWAGAESTVSTKTYITMLAANLLIAAQLSGAALEPIFAHLVQAANLIADYLANWQYHLQEIRQIPLQAGKTVLLGRGASMASVWCGSLINKEAAKFLIEGLNSADFRHGPLELVSPGFTTILFGGDKKAQALNQILAQDILERGGQVIWIGSSSPDLVGLAALPIPDSAEITRPLLEILPLQLLSIQLAQQQGLQPGIFRHVSKITLTE